MNKNYMEKVAKMLGVKIGEEFNILDEDGNKICCCPYKFTSKSLVDCNGYVNDTCLGPLISGDWKIQKLPFIPKKNEHYYYVDVNGYAYRKLHVGATLDHYCINAGNCFKTREEVTQETIDRIVKELTAGY